MSTVTERAAGEPEDGRYTVVIARSFGKRVHLPAPVDLTIDTDRLLNMVR
ncbi:hypothetical protein [Embleya sp. MST-111070]